MAAVNKLKRGSTEVELIGGADGFYIQKDGYIPATVERNRDGTYPPEVVEAVNLFVDGTSHANLASRTQALKNIIRQASEAVQDETDSNLVWWHQKLNNEATERRAVVLHGKAEQRSNVYGPPVSPGNFVQDYGLGIVRTPLWESASSSSPMYFGNMDAGGDIYNYGLAYTIIGDAPGRLNYMALTCPTGYGPLTEWWLGFRTDKFGDRTKFQPVWDCADGTPGTDTSVSGGVMVCTFGTTAMTERFTLALNQVTNITSGDEDEHRGRFLVLCRMATTSTRQARVQLKSGYTDTSTWREHDYVTVANTNYLFYEMGEIQIPPRSRHSVGSESSWKDEQYFSLALNAESITGSGNLNIDRFVVIPVAEGWCHVKNGYAYYSGGTTYRTWLMCTPQGEFLAAIENGQTVGHTPVISPDPTRGFYLPVGDGSLVMAAQRSTVQTTTDQCTIYVEYYSRTEELAAI